MSEALTTWTRGWYLCIEFKMVCKIMLSMTLINVTFLKLCDPVPALLINYHVGQDASSLKLQACGIVKERFFWLLDFTCCTTCAGEWS